MLAGPSGEWWLPQWTWVSAAEREPEACGVALSYVGVSAGSVARTLPGGVTGTHPVLGVRGGLVRLARVLAVLEPCVDAPPPSTGRRDVDVNAAVAQEVDPPVLLDVGLTGVLGRAGRYAKGSSR